MNSLARRAPVLLAVMAAGCASVSPQQRDYYDRSAEQLRSTPIAVVADSCVLRDEIGEDFLLRRTALEQGEAVLREASGYLHRRGYRVVTQSLPFLCGAVGPHLDGVRIAETAETKSSAGAPTALPIALTASSRKPAVASAWSRLFTGVAEARSASQGNYPRAFTLGTNDGQLLQRELGTSQFWLIQYSDVDVSASKSFGVAMLTGMLTLGLSGGASSFVSAPVDTLGYSVMLVDLDRGKLIWAKQTVERRAKKSDAAWIDSLFDPFLSGTPSVRVAPAAATPAAANSAAMSAAPPAASSAIPLPAVPVRPPSAITTTAASAPEGLPRAASLRSAPTPNAPILRQLVASTVIKIDSELSNATGRWLYVKGDGFHGWVLADEAGLR